MGRATDRVAELDYLRGYAVVMAASVHLLRLMPNQHGFVPKKVLAATDLGIGVDVFFVISGFVISRVLAKLWAVTCDEQARALRDVPLAFYRKRFVRLWPAAAVWLVLNYLLSIGFAGTGVWPHASQALGKMVAGFVYVYNFQELNDTTALGYFWSLSVEWQFYVVFPLVLLFVRTDVYRLAILLGCLVLSVVLVPGGPNWWMFRFEGIVLGILLYVCSDRWDVTMPAYRVLAGPAGRAAVTLGLLAAIAMSPPLLPSPRYGSLFANVLCALLVALAAADRGYVSTFGVRPLVAWLGSRSYSLYLTHIPCMLTVLSLARSSHVDLPNSVFALASATLATITAEATFRLVEIPSHRWSRDIDLWPRDAAPTMQAGASVTRGTAFVTSDDQRHSHSRGLAR